MIVDISQLDDYLQCFLVFILARGFIHAENRACIYLAS